MTLQDWPRSGWLVEHKSSPAEMRDLLGVIDRDLHDCMATGISADWRLTIAYNAALQIAIAGLAAEGYRPARESHHYRAIQGLSMTLGVEARIVTQLDAFRKKRNISDYERAGAVSEGEVQEMVALAQYLRGALVAWLRASHPKLAPE